MSETRAVALVGHSDYSEKVLCPILSEAGFSVARFRHADEAPLAILRVGMSAAGILLFDLHHLSIPTILSLPSGLGEDTVLFTLGPAAVEVFQHLKPVRHLLPEDPIEDNLHWLQDASLEQSGAREHTRHPIDVDVLVRWREETFSLRAYNLSCGGIFLRTFAPPVNGEYVEVALPSAAGEPVVLGGRVVFRLLPDLRSRMIVCPDAPERAVPGHPGFGLRFEEISERASQAIMNLIDPQVDADLL